MLLKVFFKEKRNDFMNFTATGVFFSEKIVIIKEK